MSLEKIEARDRAGLLDQLLEAIKPYLFEREEEEVREEIAAVLQRVRA